MRLCKDGRSQAERRFHPVRRDISRYGKVERALIELKDAGVESISARVVAKKANMETTSVGSMFAFTTGIDKGRKRGTYVFTGEDIRVENSVGGI